MKNIYNFSNIIKYDLDKCIKCCICVTKCADNALSLKEDIINFNKHKCIACRKCISNCPTNALFYNVNEGKNFGKNSIAIIPYGADIRLLPREYDKVIDTTLGEKVKVIETAFEMESLTSKLIEDSEKETLIISDIDNINLILKNRNDVLFKHLSKIKSQFYLSSYICRFNELNRDLGISFYGIPFEEKMFFENIKMIDEICDIPYKMKTCYSPLDILNTYMCLCRLRCNENLETLELQKNKEIILTNKYLQIKVLLTTNIESILNINYSDYHFIFVLKNSKYILRENLLKDELVNKLYKNKLKAPLKTTAFIRKD